MKVLGNELYAIQDVKSGLIINYLFDTEKDAKKYINFLVKDCNYEKDNLRLDTATIVKDVKGLIKEVKSNM